jgi:hypothetical protein
MIGATSASKGWFASLPDSGFHRQKTAYFET